MSTLDRYIARQYLVNIFVLLLLLFLFVVVVDVSLNLPRFVEQAESALKKGGERAGGVRLALETVLFVADLWWPRLLQLFTYINGLVLIGAMGFTFAQLVRHRELVAVLAGGISLYRLMRPVMVVGALMLGVQVLNQELVLPHIAHLIARDNKAIAQRSFGEFRVELVPDGERRIFHAEAFDPAARTMRTVNVWERDEHGRAVRRITADEAVYTNGAWVLKNGLARPLMVSGPQASDPGALRARPVASITTGLDPDALLAEQYRVYGHSRSWAQLFEAAGLANARPDTREQFLRIAWGRLSLLVCTMLSLIVAMPFFLTREPRNMVVQSLKCAPVALGSLLGSVLGTAAPIPGLPVEFAVWLPVLALLPTAIAMTASVKT